jgi:hypothetical protein
MYVSIGGIVLEEAVDMSSDRLLMNECINKNSLGLVYMHVN